MASLGEEFATRHHGGEVMATDGDSVAMQCLRDAIEVSGLPKKALVGDVSEKQFYKLLNGVQAFGVDRLDRLPPTIVEEFLIRYGDALGLEVRRRDPVVITEEMLALLDRLSQLSRLVKVPIRVRQAKASLSVATAGAPSCVTSFASSARPGDSGRSNVVIAGMSPATRYSTV
jgi:hypothetical protein